MNENEMDRRAFVKGSLIAGLSTAAAVLVGCSASGGVGGSSDGASGDAAHSDVDASSDASSGIGAHSGSGAATRGAGFKTDNSTPGAAKVYATSDLSAEGLLRVYEALGWQPVGPVAVKLHMGEDGHSYSLQPEMLRLVVNATGATFVDSTVLYGRRSTADGYAALARDKGFTYAPVDILDRDGGMALPIAGGAHLQSAEVGAHFANYNSMVSIAHFKGHSMAGFGGQFKNLAIGLATVPGKMSVHGTNFETGVPFTERIAEFSKGVFDALGDNMACINVLNNLSIDCDCASHPATPTMGDIGIMASLDPLALDQASVDQIYLSDDPGKGAVIERIESRSGTHLLEYAEALGIGSRAYELIVLD